MAQPTAVLRTLRGMLADSGSVLIGDERTVEQFSLDAGDLERLYPAEPGRDDPTRLRGSRNGHPPACRSRVRDQSRLRRHPSPADRARPLALLPPDPIGTRAGSCPADLVVARESEACSQKVRATQAGMTSDGCVKTRSGRTSPTCECFCSPPVAATPAGSTRWPLLVQSRSAGDRLETRYEQVRLSTTGVSDAAWRPSAVGSRVGTHSCHRSQRTALPICPSACPIVAVTLRDWPCRPPSSVREPWAPTRPLGSGICGIPRIVELRLSNGQLPTSVKMPQRYPVDFMVRSVSTLWRPARGCASDRRRL